MDECWPEIRWWHVRWYTRINNYNGTRTTSGAGQGFNADEVCPGDRQHSAAADPRRLAPSLRPDLISDTDSGLPLGQDIFYRVTLQEDP